MEQQDNCEEQYLDDTGNIRKKTKELTACICQSEEYREYKKHLEQLRNQPELFARVNEYRRKSYDLQWQSGEEGYYDRLMELNAGYADVLHNPAAMRFLTSELGVCRVMREVTDFIADHVELDLSHLQ